MELKIFLFAILVALVKSQSEVKTGFYNLPVDHFTTTDRRTFDIRYLINDDHYREDGPVFIYVSYGFASSQFIVSGNMFELAKEEGAVLIALEHRYFGRSLPTSDMSFENLQWLTVHQVVADVARFSSFMKQRYNGAPVILWGRARGGALATWARQKYPNVIDGAWGSSALINTVVEDLTFLPNTFRTINQIGGDECGQVIADAFRMIEESFESGNTSYVEQRLNMCGPIDVGNGFDLARITYRIAYDIGFNFLAFTSYPEVDEKCRIMLGLDQPENPPADPLDAFARWFIDDFHANRGTECIREKNEDYLTSYKGTEWNLAGFSGRPIFWLSCTQFGHYKTANNGQGHPFGSRFDMRFFEQNCAEVFGNDIFLDPWWMSDTIRDVNRIFGGLNPAAYRLFLTQGELDPQRSLGPANDLNPLSPVVVIPLQSNGRDMAAPQESEDYVVLHQTKLRIQNTIKEWIEYARHGEPSPPPPPSPPQFVTRWFNLPVDHFTTTDRRTFDLRYFVNENLYRENGPIFIFINDGPARTPLILGGNMFEVAQREGGVLIALEQRYFGRSLPTSDASFENLQWLTVHQIVADIGRFANFIKRQYFDAPVILWGYARGGTLATWARQKYPNVIDGAWGSSAFINAVVEDVNLFPNTFRTLNQIGGDECGQVIADAFRMIEESFDSGDTSYVEQRLMTCGPIDVGNGYDLARFTYTIADDVGANHLASATYPGVDEKCRIMLGLDQPENPPANPIDAFARWYIDVFHANLGTECITVSNQEHLTLYQNSSFSSTSSRRQWLWLSCTQYGQWHTANNGQGHPFGTRFDLRFFQQWCADAFGNDIFMDPWWMSDTIRDVNRIFGGLNPGAYRLFLTQGELDPHRSLGPAHDLNALSPVVVIPLQSFGRDMNAPDESGDYVALYQTKLRIQQTVHDWIEYARYGEPSPPPPPSPPQFVTRWFNLPVDHFTTTDRRTFDLRYFVNENHYRENGPIFIFINDGPASSTFILEGNMFEVAQREGGVLISLEERYFGRSLPTPDASFENLQWLTIHQSVADIGRFANFIKRQYFDAPVILWGRARGGALATWARQKYPNVIDGAWGSSAFINAIVENIDFYPNTFRTFNQIGGDECGQVIADAFRMIEESFESGNTSYVEQRLMTCGPIDVGNGYDLARFTYTIATNIGSSLASYPGVDEACSIMRGLNTENPPTDPLDAFARWFIDNFHANIGTECIAVNDAEYVSMYQNSSWNAVSTTSSIRQRLWLSCTQFGQLRVANNGQGHPFGSRFDLRFNQNWCADAFGNDIFMDPWWMSDTIRDVNRVFGGLNPAAYRLFLTQGELDPFRSLGPTNDLNPLSSVVVIPMQSFSRDLYAPDESGDYVVLYQTKLRIQQTVHDWIEYARYGEPSPPPPPSPPQFVTRWFNLPVDHFSTTDRRTFDLRYFVNENHYRENGPIFIYINGGPARTPFILGGNMFEVAQREGGVLIALEQRYFGRSFPTSDASFDNLQWLTVHQIVADIGRFANFIKRQYLDAPVILWGSARGGTFASWARQKYPNVIDGAWGSSAFINAVVEDVDFLPNTFRTFNQIGGDECGQVITDAFRMIEESFESGDTSYVEQRLMTCGPIDIGNGYDLARFTYIIAHDVGFRFLATASYPAVDEKCSVMRGLNTPQNPPANPLDAFARWYIDDFHLNRDTECISVSNHEQISQYQNSSWSADSTTSSRRQWLWLSCTQYGQMHTANNGQGHPFGTRFDLRFFKQWCADAFGNDIFMDPWWMSDTIRDVNRIFGGLNPGAYRLFLTQGELDPHRSLGPAHDLNALSPVVIIPLQSFGRDMNAPDESGDYVALYQTKLRIQQTVHDWIEYARYGEPSPPPPPSPPQFVTRWFNLPVDHFSTTDRRTWDIRYFVNENHYRENGPIFIYINDGPANSQFIVSGNMFEVAQREGGVLISLEERYFGRSLPTPDASFENLQWLTIHQSVADIGRFANFMKRQYFDAPVILWGRARGGALAVWARQKYPNVIDGAWGSSALINTIVEDVDFLSNAFRTINQIGGDECGQVIADAFAMIEESFESGNTSYVEQRLMTCGPIDVGNGYDLARFTYTIATYIGTGLTTYVGIDEACRTMLGLDQPENPPSDPLDAFARWFIDDLHANIGTECIKVNDTQYVSIYQDPSWNAISTTSSRRQRLWLACTQFGQFRSSNNGQGHPFGTRFDLRFFQQYCADAYENDIFLDPWWMSDTIRDVNRIFGGLNPGAYRLFLTHGELDPQRSLGPSNDLNPLSPVVVIPMQSYSRDIYAPDESGDYVALYQTKLRIQQTVHEWIEYASYGEIPSLPTD